MSNVEKILCALNIVKGCEQYLGLPDDYDFSLQNNKWANVFLAISWGPNEFMIYNENIITYRLAGVDTPLPEELSNIINMNI